MLIEEVDRSVRLQFVEDRFARPTSRRTLIEYDSPRSKPRGEGVGIGR